MQRELKNSIKKSKTVLSRFFSKYNIHVPYIITASIALAIVIGGIKLFIELTEELKSSVLAQFDTTISEFIVSFRSPALTKYFVIVTDIGDVYGYLVVFLGCSFLFYFIFKSLKYVGQLTLVMALALSSNVILKQIINRARPDLEHLVTVETLSYPSGHAMTAMAFYGFLIYLLYRFKINSFLKFGISALLVVLILSIGISRIYLGVHYPSDIAGGFIAGFIWVVFCALIFNVLKIFREDASVYVEEL